MHGAVAGDYGTGQDQVVDLVGQREGAFAGVGARVAQDGGDVGVPGQGPDGVRVQADDRAELAQSGVGRVRIGQDGIGKRSILEAEAGIAAPFVGVPTAPVYARAQPGR